MPVGRAQQRQRPESKLHLQQQQALVEAALDVEVKARVAKKQPAKKRKSK